MKRELAAMSGQQFDLLIIGGGIVGTGIARDAALRGLKTALVEKEDFGYGTTSRSTRLIHGGLRYLELLDFKLVREAMKEREVLLHIAPHLVKSLPFITPVYRGDRYGPTMVKLGLTLYDLLSWGTSLPGHRGLSAAELLRLEPGLRPEGLRGGTLYYDGQASYPERLCVENALSAADYGAQLANHATAMRFLLQDQRVGGALVCDELSGRTQEIRAEWTVNAAGPWVDRLNGPLGLPQLVRKTKGIHLVMPRFTRHAIVMLARRDGRLFFAIPWQEYSLIGTTDTDFENDLDHLSAHDDEVQYLLEETRRFFPKLRPDILYTIAGVRSLIRLEGVAPSRVPRGHKIIEHSKDGLAGLISLVGGKLTTYRELAREVVNRVAGKLGRAGRCRTGELPLYGGAITDLPSYIEQAQTSYERLGLAAEQIESLIRTYGTKFEEVLELVEREPKLGERLCPQRPEIRAQVVYGLEREMVCSSADFLLHRSGLGLAAGQGLDYLAQVSQLIGERLSWDAGQAEQDQADYRARLELTGGQAFCSKVKR